MPKTTKKTTKKTKKSKTANRLYVTMDFSLKKHENLDTILECVRKNAKITEYVVAIREVK